MRIQINVWFGQYYLLNAESTQTNVDLSECAFNALMLFLARALLMPFFPNQLISKRNYKVINIRDDVKYFRHPNLHGTFNPKNILVSIMELGQITLWSIFPLLITSPALIYTIVLSASGWSQFVPIVPFFNEIVQSIWNCFMTRDRPFPATET